MTRPRTVVTLFDKYLPYVGKTVTITAPSYVALDPKGESRTITGRVLGLAHRETGTNAGNTYDMVIQTTNGLLRTINIRRIVNCTEVAILNKPTIADADALAERAHAGQLYGNQPYITHPRAVAELLTGHGEHAIMAGLLHDTVEDTDVTLDQLRELGYPHEVVNAVDSVTRREGEPYMDLIHRAALDPLGRLVKIADNSHNSSGLDNITDPARREGLRRRYAAARIILFAALR